MADPPAQEWPAAGAKMEAVSVRRPHPNCSGFLVSKRTRTETISIPEFNRIWGTVTTYEQCRGTHHIHEDREARRR